MNFSSYFKGRNYFKMIITEIKINNDAYVHCKSSFYSAQDTLNDTLSYKFSQGINKLLGEIDSGNWAISYLIAMYPYMSSKEKKLLFLPANALVNNKMLSLKELSVYSCYLDKKYPLFSTKKTVRKLVSKGLKKHSRLETPENIRDMFHISSERFERPLSGVGNEIFRSMAAIGFCHEKQVFCFPWLSKKRFDYYHGNITDVLNILESLGKIIILPVGE